MTEIMSGILCLYSIGVTLSAMYWFNTAHELRETNRYYADWIDKQLAKREKRYEKV